MPDTSETTHVLTIAEPRPGTPSAGTHASPAEKRCTVSVVMPVHNVEAVLRRSLDCVLAQTLRDLELICVDDGSTDRSPAILEAYARKDPRVRVLRQENAGAGAARNNGMDHASGKYLIFLDSDDLFSPELLEKTVRRAEETGADIVAYDYVTFDTNGETREINGVHADWIKYRELFHYGDCPDQILSIIVPTPWTKLFRTGFVIGNRLRFDEISSTNDIAFAAVSVAMAGRIAYLKEPLVRYRIGRSGTISAAKSKKLNDILYAVDSIIRRISELPYAAVIRHALQKSVAENLLFGFRHFVSDLSDPYQREYYDGMRERLNAPLFDGLQPQDLNNTEVFYQVQAIRVHTAEAYRADSARKLFVSLTSYPARLKTLRTSLDSLLAQTFPADGILLWLAKAQFPRLEEDLPADIRALIAANKLTVRWVDEDIRPHKKYYYALREFTEDLIVTVDDDLLYPSELLENLHRAYMAYPRAVIASRCHLMLFSEEGDLLPYSDWIMETNGCMHTPMMQLLATGGAGTLYPPRLIDIGSHTVEEIREYCPDADDLWLKMLELEANVPIVQASEFLKLHCIAGTQDTALYLKNVNRSANDTQLERISRLLAEKYGDSRFIYHRVASFRPSLLDPAAVMEFLKQDHNVMSSSLKKAIAASEDAKKQARLVLASKDYRIGHLLLAPLRAVKHRITPLLGRLGIMTGSFPRVR